MGRSAIWLFIAQKSVQGFTSSKIRKARFSKNALSDTSRTNYWRGDRQKKENVRSLRPPTDFVTKKPSVVTCWQLITRRINRIVDAARRLLLAAFSGTALQVHWVPCSVVPRSPSIPLFQFPARTRHWWHWSRQARHPDLESPPRLRWVVIHHLFS